MDQAQAGVVGGALLELDVAVPSGRVVFALVLGLGPEELLALQRGYGADIVVTVTEFACTVQDRVDVQGGRRGLAAQFPEALNEYLLQVVGQVVLLSEEYNASLADCLILQMWTTVVRLGKTHL